MANFEIPFSSTGPRRSPTADEKANGHPCGPADQTLFNGLQYRIEAELGHLIMFAGLAPTDADYTQVRKAVQALIDAATGAGETENYVLFNQVTSRMPIFPEISTGDGRMNITSPGVGTVRVPGGVNLLHRGLAIYTSVQTDFATLASRTYHLRWNPTDGFQLKDLSDGAYNPTLLVETATVFDSSYDNMLVARVVTNAGNVAAITSLANKNVLRSKHILTGTPYTVVHPTGGDQATFDFAQAINFARTPDYLESLHIRGTGIGGTAITDFDYSWSSKVETRYEFSGRHIADTHTQLFLQLMGFA